ncbi:MAG: hypothetical protein K0R13_3315, partial [Propionibacteriaceae bacterium]|nr:hypothetical protein [Propionibacteriaceae bacterium]
HILQAGGERLGDLGSCQGALELVRS